MKAEEFVMQPKYARDFENEPELHQRMARVCSEPALARKFLLTAALLIKSRPDADEEFDPDFFDYGSIMMYSSTDLGQGDITRIPLARKFSPGYVPQLRNKRADGSEIVWDAYHFMGGAMKAADARPSTMDLKRLAALYPGGQAQKEAAAALKPTHMWKPMHTSEMIDSPAWGHQILETIGSLWIGPTIPDVVNKELVPTVPPSNRWPHLFPGLYCGLQKPSKRAQADVAKRTAEAVYGKGVVRLESCGTVAGQVGEAGKIEHDTKPSMTGANEDNGATTGKNAGSKSGKSAAVGSSRGNGSEVTSSSNNEAASDRSHVESSS